MGKIMNLSEIQNNENLIQFKNLILIILIIIDLIFIVTITLFDIPTSDVFKRPHTGHNFHNSIQFHIPKISDSI